MEGKPKKSPKAVRATRKKQQRKIQSLAQILLGAFLIVVVTGMLFKQSQGAPIEVAGSPSLRVDTENIDLGEVKLGQTVEVAFQLTNVGDQPLKVVQAPYVQVVEGCWPPVPTIGSMVIQPGKSTELSMTFMMHGDMGGPHDFRVHVLTNDAARPDRVLTVLSDWVP